MPRRKQTPRPPTRRGEIAPDRPISLKTLGAYLDLSPATLSLVLNNAPGVRSIPQETRDRVLAAAKKFDYRPSFYARSLRGRRSFSIGVLVPELSDGYSVHVLNGIEEVLIEEGYFYLTVSHRRKADLITEYARLLLDRSVEGFIAIDTALETSLPLPAVSVAGQRRIPGVTGIQLDHRRAAELSLCHLNQLGHRRIAFMRGLPSSSDSEARWSSLMQVAQELNIEVRPELVLQIESNVSTPELGYPITRALLERERNFTALVSFNDLAAIGAIRALHDVGLRVPHDVSIVGFDDFESAAYHTPSLTTIRQPLRSMGNTAARLLLRRVRGEKDVEDHIAIVPELVVRESTQALQPPSRHG